MARPLRFEYPGTVYHVMARGDGGKRIFFGKDDLERPPRMLDRVQRDPTTLSMNAKHYKKPLLLIALLVFASPSLCAEQQLTGASSASVVLDDQSTVNSLSAIKADIDTVLADSRLTDENARQLLTRSKAVIAEMLTTNDCSNVEKLVELAKWMKDLSDEALTIQKTGGPRTPQQHFVTDNPLNAQSEGLACRLREVLSAYVQADGLETAPAKLEGYFQLYLHFVKSLEIGATGIPDFLLLKSPEWMKDRFAQLTPQEKRKVLQDINDARKSRTEPPADDGSIPSDPPTPGEQAAYEAAYEFIRNTMPPP